MKNNFLQTHPETTDTSGNYTKPIASRFAQFGGRVIALLAIVCLLQLSCFGCLFITLPKNSALGEDTKMRPMLKNDYLIVIGLY